MKSRGSDGFTAEFYNIIWEDIQDIPLNSIKTAFQAGKLSITQKHGIITLLPKKDKDILRLKNWWPIYLLNTDYKLIAKCIAIWIKEHLSALIHNDQTSFLKGRYIGQYINKLLTIMNYTDQKRHTSNSHLHRMGEGIWLSRMTYLTLALFINPSKHSTLDHIL